MALKIQPSLSELKAILHLETGQERGSHLPQHYGDSVVFAHRQVPSASFLTSNSLGKCLSCDKEPRFKVLEKFHIYLLEVPNLHN